MDGVTPTDTNEAAGVVLRHVRTEARLTDAEIAERAGLTRTSVNRYLNGRRDIPLGLVLAIADLAQQTPASIVERIEQQIARGAPTLKVARGRVVDPRAARESGSRPTPGPRD